MGLPAILEPFFAVMAAVSAVAFAVTLLLTLGARWRFDRQRRLLRTVYDRLGDVTTRTGADGRRHREIEATLADASRPLLWSLASDATAPLALVTPVAYVLTRREGSARLRQAAESGSRWRRPAALRTLILTEHPDAWTLVRTALDQAPVDVARDVVALLGPIDDPRAAVSLVHALQSGRVPQSRTASALDEFPRPIPHLIHGLLDDPNPDVRFWGCNLMRRYPETPGLRTQLETLSRDAAPHVRKASVDALARLDDRAAVPALSARLDDPVAYVRAHAVRALGAVSRGTAAGAIVRALADPDWWVRTAAKETLEQLGETAVPAVVTQLADPDGFARNGAAEVLQNLGVYLRLLRAEAEAPGDAERQRLLGLLAAAGGDAMWHAHLLQVPPALRVRARRLVRTPAAAKP